MSQGDDEELCGLDILCNQVESEKAKEAERIAKLKMNMRLDMKLAQIKDEKRRAKESQFVQET